MTVKIAVSLPDDQVAALKRHVAEGRFPSVSAAVSHALADAFATETYDEFLADLVREAQPTEQDWAWARQAVEGL